MATHDYSIANQSFPATRADINNALTAIKSSNSDSTAPTTSLVTGQLFYDTSNSVLKVYGGSSFNIVAGSAGSGLDLSVSGVMSVERDLREVDYIGMDSTDYIHFSNNSTMEFYVNGGERARLLSNGDLHVDGDITAFSTTISDERLKTGITTVTDALTKVSQLNGVEFTRKNSGQRSAGVIAQQVEKVLPQAVKEKTLPLQTGDEDTTYKTVEYDALHSLYIEAIKELKDMVEKQAAQIKELQGA
jgi:hypothetical protein